MMHMLQLGKSLLIGTYTLAISLAASAQPQNEIKNLLFAGSKVFPADHLKEVREVYALQKHRLCWLTDQEIAGTFREVINSAAEAGLSASDYLFPQLVQYLDGSARPATAVDSAAMDIWFTFSAVQLLTDFLSGGDQAPVSYDGLKMARKYADIPHLLYEYLTAGRFAQVLTNLEPPTPVYNAARKKRLFYQSVTRRPGFADIVVHEIKTATGKQALAARLMQLGLIDDEHRNDDSLIKRAVQQAQVLFNIHADGFAGQLTLNQLNVPLERRITELGMLLNALRWMHSRNAQDKIIIVNIPSANLFISTGSDLVMESKIIAGKPATPTPTLSSRVTEVVLYPYWHVPYSIATRELLPMIRKNPRMLEQGNYQVLDSRGRIVPPGRIDWQSLSAKNFPYVLRQSTGCDNALGWIKLNFDSPYSVYLHDTPGKALFSWPKRFFSHGCMRVEKATELARSVLGGNAAVLDSLEKLGPLKNQSPVPVKLTEPVPVFVLYQTAWFNSMGEIYFCEDIYRRIPSTYNGK